MWTTGECPAHGFVHDRPCKIGNIHARYAAAGRTVPNDGESQKDADKRTKKAKKKEARRE